jgi:hypothetical protein
MWRLEKEVMKPAVLAVGTVGAKQLNVFEGKVYRRILDLVYDKEKDNGRILTNKEMYAIVKKTYHNRDDKAK